MDVPTGKEGEMISFTDILIVTGAAIWAFWGFFALACVLRWLNIRHHRRKIKTPGLNLQDMFKKGRMN